MENNKEINSYIENVFDFISEYVSILVRGDIENKKEEYGKNILDSLVLFENTIPLIKIEDNLKNDIRKSVDYAMEFFGFDVDYSNFDFQYAIKVLVQLQNSISTLLDKLDSSDNDFEDKSIVAVSCLLKNLGFFREAKMFDKIAEVMIGDDNVHAAIDSFLIKPDLQKLNDLVSFLNSKVPVEKSADSQHCKDLVVLADKLDQSGMFELADHVDKLISKYASKKGDSSTLREPKTKEDRFDVEHSGEGHHVRTYNNTGTLSTRHCPEHIGVMLERVSDGKYTCPIDKKTYDWSEGWTDSDGNSHPGGSISGQTPGPFDYQTPHRIFDTRSNKLK